jgi:2-aminoethylphosphonate-pyruvate transaminase
MRQRIVLMNPGPVLIHETVRNALLREDICHREVEFTGLLKRIRAMLCQICSGDETIAAVVLTGSGTTALEATISSVIPHDGKILIIDNGHYGERLLKIASAYGISAHHLAFGWSNRIDLDEVDRVLAENESITHVAMVHHETSTGMINPVGEVGRITAKYKRQLILDAVSSLGGENLDVCKDHVDWCVSSSNKCIEGVPGTSFVCAPHVRFKMLESIRPRTFSLDLHAHYISQEITQAPLFTPAVQTLYALDCALELLINEGVPQRISRYRSLSASLRQGLSGLGFRFLLPPQQRSNSLTVIYLPPQIAYEELHDRLKSEGFVIYASQQSLQYNTFRLANMGQITLEEINRFLKTIEKVL